MGAIFVFILVSNFFFVLFITLFDVLDRAILIVMIYLAVNILSVLLGGWRV